MIRTLTIVLALSPAVAGQGRASRRVKPQPQARFSGRPRAWTPINVAQRAGLTAPIMSGNETSVQFISETSPGGLAFVNHDDGRRAALQEGAGTPVE